MEFWCLGYTNLFRLGPVFGLGGHRCFRKEDPILPQM